MLYEIPKKAANAQGPLHCLDVENRNTLPDVLPEDIALVLLFSPDCKVSTTSMKPLDTKRPTIASAYLTSLATEFVEDREVFLCWRRRENSPGTYFRQKRLAFFRVPVFRRTLTDIYLKVLR